MDCVGKSSGSFTETLNTQVLGVVLPPAMPVTTQLRSSISRMSLGKLIFESFVAMQ